MKKERVYYCPLKSSPFECNENCAWFDNEWGECVLQTIAFRLYMLNDTLEKWVEAQGIDLLDM